MAGKLENTAQRVKRESFEALPRIVKETLESEKKYAFCTPDIAKYLEKNEFIEVNLEITNDGAVATRALEKAINYIKEKENKTLSESTTESFEIESGFTAPESKRGGVGNTKYPFDKLEVGQAFFVPATAERPDPVKALQSTVAGATNRYAEVVKDETTGEVKMRKNKKDEMVPETKKTRIFKIKAEEKEVDGKKIKGALIGRIQ